MPPVDYCELVNTESEFEALTKYVKPNFSAVPATKNIKRLMLEKGCETLIDAFSIIKSEHLFNIYNSNLNRVEEFTETNAKYYSQGQCAIVIERIFSRLYKYL